MQEQLIAYLSSHGLEAFFASFGVGVLTAAAPCSIITLPLLVGSAVALSSDIKTAQVKKRFTIYYSLLFTLGLVISFSILMLLVAKIGIMLSIAPLWADILAAFASFLVAFYALGWLGSGINKEKIAKKLLRFKLFGALIIGVIFGLVSTPCASAPLVAIITVAQQSSNWLQAYMLVLAFAFGHASLLLVSGISLGFAQSVASSKILAKISRALNGIFIIMLLGIGVYYLYKAWQIV